MKEMAKYVTRTVVSYRYTVGKIKMEGGNIILEDSREFFADKKLGERVIAKKLKDSGLDGYTVLNVETVKEKYAVPVETFMEHAVKVENYNDIEED